MPLYVTPSARGLRPALVVLMISLGTTAAGQATAGASARDDDGRPDTWAEEGVDVLGGLHRVLAGLTAWLDGARSPELTVGPGSVSGNALCPPAADGHAHDCAAAARVLCARAGFGSGIELDKATRRVCRGTILAVSAGGDDPDCRTKTSVTRALCW